MAQNESLVNVAITAGIGAFGVVMGWFGIRYGKSAEKAIATEKNLWERVKDLEARLDRQHKECDERIDALEKEVEVMRQKNYELQAKVYQLEHPETRNEPHAG